MLWKPGRERSPLARSSLGKRARGAKAMARREDTGKRPEPWRETAKMARHLAGVYWWEGGSRRRGREGEVTGGRGIRAGEQGRRAGSSLA